MADPAALALAVKTAIGAARDERSWKTISVVIAAILTPFILIIVMITSLLSGTAGHNNTAVQQVFHSGVINGKVPEDFRRCIEEMREAFTELDAAISEMTLVSEEGSLDLTQVKAIFYALFFGTGSLHGMDYRAFADCFVRYEERTRSGTGQDGGETVESCIVAVPLESLLEIYANLERTLGRGISSEDQANAAEIYDRALYGTGKTASAGEFISPLGSGWRSMVTSEFGGRIDPFTGSWSGHTGLDLGAAKGTAIRAAQGGTVEKVSYDSRGYGYYLTIAHGGGMVTLYGHCSQILVVEGQAVNVGDVVAKVGSTGRSTGNHLHFEVIVNGIKENPRNYLP
ncbi:Membrane proteins related to metalloendopeptidases [Desulfitobacterium sp. LBE]|uniref:M23ase beta-sheet core domain-containing protein n=1 Tax=bioreactor metagenome TaxID=1076179 RepID=A0A644W9T3_9ZZZZ|nr:MULTISPECIES: M23 family metallopeptidase [Desulfitobacterium]MEA5026010.1 M23 family metallopeptidase [Desulfitobacterium hafniense]TWH59569.1 Membrane proteins related to metalloendopeptidases [Desulfitobacterium sp. LBE]